MVIDCGPDIINFDAYDYTDTLALYPEQLRTFLEKAVSLHGDYTNL
jgi:hypothetical protein